MFGRKCSLCGGKLNSKNVCTECGLDNTKSDRDYKINQSSCDNQPLTHVHPHPEETDSRRKQTGGRRTQTNRAPEQKRQTPYQQPSKKSNSKKRIVLFPVIIMLVGMLISVISTIGNFAYEWGSSYLDDTAGIFENDEDFEYESEVEYDPYAYAVRELSEDGERFSIVLSQGEYVGGIHLPEGRYTVSTAGSYVSINVEDPDNSIWLYENLGASEEARKDDIRIYAGAKVEICGEAEVTFSTENAQMDIAALETNPLTDTVILSGAEATAGQDFAPGTYDLSVENDYGSIHVMIYDSYGLVEESYIWLDADNSAEKEYKNLVLPKGAQISCEGYEDLVLVLKPSEGIVSQDYLSYYIEEGEDYGE